MLATIVIPLGPEIRLGPLVLAWHGLMIAVGLFVALLLARRFARELRLDPERVTSAYSPSRSRESSGRGFCFWPSTSPCPLDVLAAAFPFAPAIGRVGDLINGEHYGPPTDLPWGVRHADPGALVPSTALAYHDGGLYEICTRAPDGPLIWPLLR